MSTPPAKKACDACHRRKIRCTGGQPCKNCGQATLQCTYLAVPQKKGPKGSRAKVISEIRDIQQQAAPIVSPTTQSQPPESSPFDFNNSPLSPSSKQTPGLLPRQTVETCIDFFFEHLHVTYPIFQREQLYAAVASVDSVLPEIYCLIAALCAFIMVQPGMNLNVSGALGESYEGEPPQSRYGYASMLLEDLLRVRKTLDLVESPSLAAVQTSFLLFSSYFGLENQNACWFYSREAATLAQIMRMDDEATYAVGHPVESVYKRRTYWLLVVTERAYAMERHRTLTLHPTIELPVADGLDQQIIEGHLHLIKLFTIFDDEFMALWNKTKTACSAQWLSHLQKQLSDALPLDLRTTAHQEADIRITQQWLKIMVWQLSMANNALSSRSTHVALTFKYPVVVAQALIHDVKQMGVASLEVHGVGLIEKLFDVACTLTDVIACVPLESTSPQTEQPTDVLKQFLDLVSQLRGGASRYLPLLLAKVSDNLPDMTVPNNQLPLSIKQGYAGATDGQPIPRMPQTTTTPGNTMSPPTGYFSARNSQKQGRMFDTYSPDLSGGGTPLSPLMANPLNYRPPILAPMPRSAPVTHVSFEGYPT